MTVTASQINRASEISFDAALEEVAKMTDVQTNESGGVVVYSGVHPDHGNIHVVVPSFGAGFLLYPFAIRDF